ncbi:hypothetical protein ABEV00_10590 [Paenibacillus thiaminolyticus]|uniref:hypothetical protein n=1 Tax=Paenibacillus TaxID=44249 RepID=UPI00105939C5|nr:hypothetical protein [Paenibacillus dendritiformis]TDL50251.1 hypothetical protein E2R60_22125 [Paenibacillus dendritiformis]
MSNLKPDSIVTLLKFLDMDFITDEQYDKICDLDINNQEEQLQVIRAVIVPGYYTLNEKDQRSTKKVLEMCLEEKKPLNGIFVSISMPFDSEITNKKVFFKNIYKELFRGK